MLLSLDTSLATAANASIVSAATVIDVAANGQLSALVPGQFSLGEIKALPAQTGAGLSKCVAALKDGGGNPLGVAVITFEAQAGGGPFTVSSANLLNATKPRSTSRFHSLQPRCSLNQCSL